VRAAIARLGDLGAEVVEVSIPWVRHAFAPANLISWVESSVYHRTWRDRWESDYGDELLQRCVIGSAISGTDYLLAQEARRAIVAKAAALMEQIDVLATPCCPIPAPPIEPEQVQVGPVVEPMRSAMGRLCRLGSFTGFPATAVPCGFSSDGLPLSMQLLAAPFQEGRLIRMAYAYEQATPWRERRPPVD
jgi:aspartyl-tRNA(Asn)/glutamyl-tRNA(Gln) amidotransferase subunit A